MVSFADPRDRHPFHMHDMILGQPAFVEETLRRMRTADARSFLGTPRTLVVTGCGTSFHAAMYGAEVLQAALGDRAAVRATHAYDLVNGDPPEGVDVVLGISHSGNTSTTNRALAIARRSGARAMGLCGLPESPMDEVADEVLAIGSTHDRSWANTMSYTTQLTALACLATSAGSGLRSVTAESLAAIPRKMRRALETEDVVRRLARRVAARKRIAFLGSGLEAITALEAALKIRETCSLPASGYHVEQFLHGPFLSIDRDESIVMLRSRDDGTRTEEILRGLAAAGSPVTSIGDHAKADIPLPVVPRPLRPVVSVVPLQFLAYYAALARKANPDIMRSDQRRFQRALEPLFH